jgi:trehalose 2-sulfotransferase
MVGIDTRPNVTVPSRSVVICCLPRTGSSLLGHMLYETGAVGWPGEWFWREDVERNWTAWGVSSWSDYVARVLEAGTGPTGVFCTKLMWGYLHDALFELRRLSRMYGEDDLAVLRAFFPEASFVWVRRKDVVAQAVSWAKAAQTGQWASFQPVQAEPAFDFDQIDALYNLARVHDGAWARWFAAHGIAPLRVVYEELAADPADVVEGVIARLGLERSPVEGRAPMELARQADAVNRDWAARYRRRAKL